MDNLHSKKILALANIALREKEYKKAIGLYEEFIKKVPELKSLAATNIYFAEKKLKLQYDKSERTSPDCESKDKLSEFSEKVECNKSKLAVLVHAFYPDVFEKIIAKLSGIECAFDLFVSSSPENKEWVRSTAIKKFPNTNFLIFENIGMDIYPFLESVKILSTKGYDIVCKLHTKRGDGPLGDAWQKIMLDSLIGSEEGFAEVKSYFENKPNLGMVGPAGCYQSAKRLMLENKEKIEKLHSDVFVGGVNNEDWGFFCGTMFWARLSLFERLQKNLHKFKNGFGGEYKKDGLIEHALERMFGLLPVIENKDIGLIHRDENEKYSCLEIGKPLDIVGHADIRDVLAQYSRINSDAALLNDSKLFDSNYYKQTLPLSLRFKNIDLVEHYLLIGSHKSKQPNEFFSPSDYRLLHKDVVKFRIDPFVHYINSGAREGRRTWLNDTKEKHNTGFRFRVIQQEIINWEKLSLVVRSKQLASVIIPVYGQPDLLEKCIESIYKVKNKIKFEVVLVDNRYDEATTICINKIASERKSVVVVKNNFNLNFSLGCNVGFIKSKGFYTIFLNSDTEVTDNWIEHLISPLAHESIVAVQPKLIYSDGTVQCIGMVTSPWSALPYQLYNGASKTDKHINYARQFHVVSAACIAVRSENFIQAEGFDPLYVNGWEDVDFCLKLTSDKDRKCWYTPDATVIHHESKSHGRGKYVEVNRKIFLDKWRGAVTEDAEQNYLADGFLPAQWKPDNLDFLEKGIAMYFPALEKYDTSLGRDLLKNTNSPFVLKDFSDIFSVRSSLDFYIKGESNFLEDAPTVLLVAHSSSTEIFGSERSFLDLLSALKSISLNVIVTLPARPGLEYFESILKECFEVWVFYYEHWTQKKPHSNPAINRFKYIIKNRNVDYVYSNTIMNNEASMAAHSSGVPLITHVRELVKDDVALESYIGMDAIDIANKIEENSDCIVANSKTTANMFLDQMKVITARNVVQFSDFDFENIINPNRIFFGLVSSNIPKKGIYDFFELAKRCEKLAPNVVFSLIGPINDHIKKIINGFNSDNFPRNTLISGYANSSYSAISSINVVLSLSNFSESFGRTIAEGFAASRPAIGYNRGAVPELIKNNYNGYLVDSGDMNGLVNAVIKFSSSPQLIKEFGVRGREYVMNNCSFPQLRNGILTSLLISHLSKYSSSIQARNRLLKTVEAWSQSNLEKYYVNLLSGLLKHLCVIIPIYNAYEELLNCWDSVREKCKGRNIKFILIDDGSTDRRVKEFLFSISSLDNVEVLFNEANIGYTKTINKAINFCGDSDVILLNSDTVVTDDWILALRLAAYSRANIGTVTALSNNSGVFSFPEPGKHNSLRSGMTFDEHADVILQAVSSEQNICLPTGNGFCMLIKRDLILKIGYFDENNFPRGYGEENDFCMRANHAGFENILTPSAFVFHVKSASFKNEREKLVKEGEANLARLHPSYFNEVAKAFGSDQLKNLRCIIREALSF